MNKFPFFPFHLSALTTATKSAISKLKKDFSDEVEYGKKKEQIIDNNEKKRATDENNISKVPVYSYHHSNLKDSFTDNNLPLPFPNNNHTHKNGTITKIVVERCYDQ